MWLRIRCVSHALEILTPPFIDEHTETGDAGVAWLVEVHAARQVEFTLRDPLDLSPRPVFLNLGTAAGMSNSIPGLYALDDSSTPPSCDMQKCLQVAKCPWEDHWPREPGSVGKSPVIDQRSTLREKSM